MQAGGFDENLLIQALGNLPGAGNAPGTVILCSRAILNEMNIRAVSQKTNGYYTQNAETGDTVWESECPVGQVHPPAATHLSRHRPQKR